jgi:hypothetical protein
MHVSLRIKGHLDPGWQEWLVDWEAAGSLLEGESV